jgi:hypothetical protein
MKISRPSNTVIIAFLLAGTSLMLAEEDKSSDRCGFCHEQETKDWEASKQALRSSPEGNKTSSGTKTKSNHRPGHRP